MRLTFAIILLAIAACVVGIWYWASGWDETPRFRSLPIQRDELLIAISATGTVEPMEVIDVGAQINGRIKEFGPDLQQPGETVDFCSEVTKGAVLAQLDDSPYLAALDRSRAILKLTEAELTRHRAHLNRVEQDYERAEKLRKTNSETEYDQAVAQYEMAKADIAVGEAKVEQANIAKKQAEIDLGYATIASPIDGVIIDRRVNVGQTVVAGLNAPSLFLLARDLSKMQVWAAVNEADVGDVHIGQKVTSNVDAFRDTTFSGKVSQIRLNASMSQNVVTYGVVVDIENTHDKLLPYMTANLQFEVARRTDVLLVPNQALRWKPTWEQITPAARSAYKAPQDEDGADESPKIEADSPTIWVRAEEGLVRPITVTLGLSDGMVTVQGDGLEADLEAVVGTVRQRRRDFVSSFISRVVKPKNRSQSSQ